MKGLKLSCTSPAATAISTTNDQWSSSTHRGLDRPRDRRRQKTLNPFSNLTHLSPLKPKHHQHKSQNTSSSDQPIGPISPPGSTRYLLGDAGMSDAWSDLDEDIKIPEFLPFETTRSQPVKSSASTSSGVRHREPLVIDRMRFRSIEPEESPVFGVSRYKASFAIDRTRFRTVEPDESPVLKTPTISTSTSTSRPEKQVVVLKVSLHCKGCEGKVRKHISRMEGVTSFNIDFATKKVTVIGDVTPLGVLASVSRVKNAQLWPSSAAADSVSSN